MAEKERFKAKTPVIAGSSFINLLQVFKGHHIDPKYYPKALNAAFISLVGVPIRLWEHIRYDHIVNRFKIKHPPIFIIGHWRSGTTHLHNLITRDPRFGFVTTYQSVFPEAVLGGKWLFKSFMKAFMPRKRPMDNMELSPDYPQEEEFALGNMNPYCFYYFWFFPSHIREYLKKYVFFEGVKPSVIHRWKKDYLRLIKKALLNTQREIFVSKNPPNTGRIPVLLDMFPGARFIHIYRNPVTVFRSTLLLHKKTIGPLTFEDVNDAQIEENVLYVYEALMKKYFKDQALIPKGQLVEIRYEDFENNELEWLREVYDSFGIGGFEKAVPYFRRYLEKQKSYKKNKHTITRAQLEKVLQRWGFAMEKWGYAIPDNIEIIDDVKATSL